MIPKLRTPRAHFITVSTAIMGAALIATLTACGSSGSSPDSSPSSVLVPTNAQPGVAAPSQDLVKRAEDEGKVVWYNGNLPNSDQVIAAFEKKYPEVKVTQLQLPGSGLQARFNAEAAAGKTAADVLSVGYSSSFIDNGFDKGYLTPTSSVIPDFKTAYPAKWQLDNGRTGITLIVPTGFAVNTDLAQGSLPATWADLAAPQWKGKLICIDPNSSVAAIQFWEAIIHKYGEGVAKSINANIKRYYPSLSLEVAALAAGEGTVALSANNAQVTALTQKGAPLKFVSQPFETGAEYATVVAKLSPDPAAAALFANFLYSAEGQAAASHYAEGSAPLIPQTLPADYYPPNFGAEADLAKINGILGTGK